MKRYLMIAKLIFKSLKRYSLVNCVKMLDYHCVKHATIQVFSYSYFLLQGQNLRFWPYTGKHASTKTCALAYFTQYIFKMQNLSLREKCLDTELFLVRIFLYSDWIWRFTQIRSYFWSVFGHISRSVTNTFLQRILSNFIYFYCIRKGMAYKLSFKFLLLNVVVII